MFRVRAVNEHGTGKASAVSDSVVAKALAGNNALHTAEDRPCIAMNHYYVCVKPVSQY